jgi:carboxymethylenebutenolidase
MRNSWLIAVRLTDGFPFNVPDLMSFLHEQRKEKMMRQELMDLYEKHSNGFLDRRDFMKRLALIAGTAAAAHALLPLVERSLAMAQITARDDARLILERMKYAGETGEVRSYFARPKGDAKLPGVVVIHENRGLNAHIEDVTRRIALAGFLALAPDALSPLGGTPEDSEKAPALFGQLDKERTTKDFVAAVKYLKTHPLSTGKVGVVGFCWGGAMANQVAVHSPDLVAAVPYYGAAPASEDVPKIKASLLLHYAGVDERINAGIPAFEAALKAASKDYKLYMYEGAKHAFNNDMFAERYNKDAAQLAWQRTEAFLKEKLKS